MGRAYARQSWWRSQRSVKFWAIIEQFQFIAMTGAIGVQHPRLWMTFSGGFAWSNLWLKTVWESAIPRVVGTGVQQLARQGLFRFFFFHFNA